MALNGHLNALGRCPLSGVKRTSIDPGEMSAFDPKRTFQLFSRDPVRYIVAGCDLAPNDIDVTAQIIDLVREG